VLLSGARSAGSISPARRATSVKIAAAGRSERSALQAIEDCNRSTGAVPVRVGSLRRSDKRDRRENPRRIGRTLPPPRRASRRVCFRELPRTTTPSRLPQVRQPPRRPPSRARCIWLTGLQDAARQLASALEQRLREQGARPACSTATAFARGYAATWGFRSRPHRERPPRRRSGEA